MKQDFRYEITKWIIEYQKMVWIVMFKICYVRIDNALNMTKSVTTYKERFVPMIEIRFL